jgi:alkylation response protein AidB-like acyl-CoA dehydrogenase
MKTGGQFLTSAIADTTVFSPENFSDVHHELAKAMQNFAQQEILPQKEAIEKFDKDLSLQLIKNCGELGFLGVDIPERYGGLGLDKVSSALLAEKIAGGETESFSLTFFVHTGIGTLPIVNFGSEDLKKKYLPRIASGEWLSSYALTEPGSGTDALSLRSEARLAADGQFYILNGSKQFISNGSWAKVLITFAKIDGEKLTGFIIDPESPGVIRQEEKNKLGLRGSSTCNIILENVQVPVENILGEIGKGADIAFNSLNIGRFKLGAAVLGGCKTAIEYSCKYGFERRQFGQPIATFDAIQKKTAEMLIQTFALESIIYHTAHQLDEAIAEVDESSLTFSHDIAQAIEKYAIECSISKVFGSESYWNIADEGLQIYGGYGFIEDFPMARMLRDTRVDRIYEGTNEINRQIILGYVIKKTLLEELPIREKVRKLQKTHQPEISPPAGDSLAAEKQALENAKQLTLYLFDEALSCFGQDLLNHQQIGEILSDMISNLYILNTTLGRIHQNSQHPAYSLMLQIGKALAARKILEMNQQAQLILPGIHEGRALKKSVNRIQQFIKEMNLETNIFSARRKIAESLYQYKKYPF